MPTRINFLSFFFFQFAMAGGLLTLALYRALSVSKTSAVPVRSAGPYKVPDPRNGASPSLPVTRSVRGPTQPEG